MNIEPLLPSSIFVGIEVLVVYYCITLETLSHGLFVGPLGDILPSFLLNVSSSRSFASLSTSVFSSAAASSPSLLSVHRIGSVSWEGSGYNKGGEENSLAEDFWVERCVEGTSNYTEGAVGVESYLGYWGVADAV